MLSDLINIERDKMQKKQIEYEKALKNEIKSLNNDIFLFDQFTTNEMLEN